MLFPLAVLYGELPGAFAQSAVPIPLPASHTTMPTPWLASCSRSLLSAMTETLEFSLACHRITEPGLT